MDRTTKQNKLIALGLTVLLALGALSIPAGATDAAGGSFVFPFEGFRYEAPADWRVLTQHNLAEHADFLTALGTTPEAVLASFQTEHVVMELLPPGGGQISLSIVSAGGLSRVEPEALQEAYAAMPRYQQVAFSADEPDWLRMIFSTQQGEMAVYTLRYVTLQHGQQYMLSSAVIGREPDDTDDALVLEAISHLSFLSALSTPEPTATPAPSPTPTATPKPTPGIAALVSEAPGLTLTLNDPPAWVDTPSLTLTGATLANASVRAYIGEDSIGKCVARGNGTFSLAIKLPATGPNAVRIEATLKGEQTAAQTYEIQYEQPVLPLSLSAPLETIQRADVVIKGDTAPGAKVTIQGDKTNAHVNANAQGVFSIRLKLDKEGTYRYTLTSELSGWASTSLPISIVREYNDREALAAFRQALQPAPAYNKLLSSPETYAGKNISFRGKIMQIAELDGQPCLLMSTKPTSLDAPVEPAWVVSDQLLTYAVGDVITAYVRIEGKNMPYTNAAGRTMDVPLLRLHFHAK